MEDSNSLLYGANNTATTTMTFTSTLLNELSNVSTDFSTALYDAKTENPSTEFSEQIRSHISFDVTNVTKIIDSIQNMTKVNDVTINSTQPSILNVTTKASICSTTAVPFDEFGPPDGVQYIFVPLGVMVFVIILSAVVLIISRKRKLERLRHRLMPLYNFDPGEEGEDDWETELLDENFDNRQKRQGYQSMDTEENAELFSGR